MIKTNIYCVLFLFIPLFTLNTQCIFGQKEINSNVHLFLEGGLNFGGKISSNNFSYKSGESIEFGMMKTINEKTDIGIGIGMNRLDDDYFYPVSFRVESKIFKNENFIFLFQSGYSFAKTKSEITFIDVNLNGGLFMETGRAWNIKLNEHLNLLSTLSFKYQFAEKEFETISSEFSENEDFIYLMFKIGLLLK